MSQDDEQTITALLTTAFMAAVDASRPTSALPPFVSDLPRCERTIVLGAGKAASAMARIVERRHPWPCTGLVVTRYGHLTDDPPRAIEVVEARHPVPDAAGMEAARRILALASAAGPGDRVIFLISGGGSALLSLPSPGVSLAEKQALNAFLLASGAPIDAINTVRKHVSQIKGGRLARAAHPAEMLTLAISDVPGDRLEDIASGPTVADPTTRSDARAILDGLDWPGTASITAALDNPDLESPKPEEASAWRSAAHVIASPRRSLDAAKRHLEADGWPVIDLGDRVEGEAREVGAAHARMALEARRRGERCVLLSGGELTVTLENPDGKGGPNLEYLTGMALELRGAAGVYAIACDTDGVDGSEDNAGGLITPDVLARAGAAGADVRAMLARNDSYVLFKMLDALVMTGPTSTNVSDFRAIAVA
ncbi:MAG: glycerate kinase [Caulobacterales bacterium]|nr:glycerate kinase [Caulobacterales bacterium]